MGRRKKGKKNTTAAWPPGRNRNQEGGEGQRMYCLLFARVGETWSRHPDTLTRAQGKREVGRRKMYALMEKRRDIGKDRGPHHGH